MSVKAWDGVPKLRLVEAADALAEVEKLQARLADVLASLNAALVVAGFEDMAEEFRLHAMASLVRAAKDILDGKS